MDSPKVEVRLTKKRGRGVFAIAPILKDETIAEFDGTTYDLENTDWNDELADHVIQIGRTQWRDSHGVARFFNHSCEPNCGIHGLSTIVAMRDIAVGEELTWDYDMSEDNYYWDMICHCGAPHCRKEIGAFRKLPQEFRDRYKGYISDWLVREYGL